MAFDVVPVSGQFTLADSSWSRMDSKPKKREYFFCTRPETIVTTSDASLFLGLAILALFEYFFPFLDIFVRYSTYFMADVVISLWQTAVYGIDIKTDTFRDRFHNGERDQVFFVCTVSSKDN